ncbi:class 1 fructose-bisphosphatase [Nitratifractor salsuginis]|uniref:Fructose-1,6-bisphosphatase class 1 n=1 Tax=Nitratifractor salsuginis (strain DSM 16511 / JCM 12458 / E9I37-1) TaxID=749222 RepID=E6WXU2_NITSE|nr:class 1 fructose-bisphosphatase [Nitratifractor salsuginis]ADV46349.1 D-fructose 1,6-bisphosphatase [Nitratifractor salsuginis DSM 16511]
MQTIFQKIKEIALKVDQAIKDQEMGYSEQCNASGDDQLKLDVYADELVEYGLRELPLVKAIISEEKEDVMPVHEEGKYTICYDPLDGSSIVDVNLSVGTIFGIYEGEPSGETLVASAYIVYGPRIEMVTVTRGGEVQHYRSGSSQLFNLCYKAVRLEEKGKLNAPGGTQKNWPPHHKAFIDSLFAEGYRLRYSGGMVPDLHQILLKGGGLFSYPGTSDKPDGKLRLLFEVLPFALIYETAGGEAVNEQGKRLLELKAKHIHDTSPCFFGSRYEIHKMKEAYGVL